MINIYYPPESFGTALGTYPLFISFTEPGVYSFDTGVSLRLYDICDESTFPSPPVISPVQDAEYWIALEGVNGLEFNVAWDDDSSTALGFNCGPFEI